MVRFVLLISGLLAAGLITAGVALMLLRQPPAAVWQCAGTEAGAERRVLVIGDSWATYSTLLEGLTGAEGPGAGAKLRACAVGFSGATTWQIGRRMAADGGFADRVERELGGRADIVLVTAGLNDLMLHAGPRSYAEGLVQLTRQAEAIAPRVATLSLPALDPDGQSTHLARRMLGAVNRYLNDGGESDPRPRYVAAYCAAARHPVIPLPGEIAGFSPGAYVDAAHLTPAAYRRLGAHLGAHLARQLDGQPRGSDEDGQACGDG